MLVHPLIYTITSGDERVEVLSFLCGERGGFLSIPDTHDSISSIDPEAKKGFDGWQENSNQAPWIGELATALLSPTTLPRVERKKIRLQAEFWLLKQKSRKKKVRKLPHPLQEDLDLS